MVEGIPTVIPFDLAVVTDPDFAPAEGPFKVHTRWIETEFVNSIPAWSANARALKRPTPVSASASSSRSAASGLRSSCRPAWAVASPRFPAVRAPSPASPRSAPVQLVQRLRLRAATH